MTSITIEPAIKQVATAIIVGLNCSLKPVHICIGTVVWPGPAKNKTTTTSSKDVTNANNAPEITPGVINGSITLKKVLVGVLPRLEAALVRLWSNPIKVAVTVITTNGVPRIICDIIIPIKEEDNPTLAKKKNRAEPDIINGTIIGDIKMLITKALYGIYFELNPSAARVPKIVAPIVEKKAIIKLFLNASPHGFFVP